MNNKDESFYVFDMEKTSEGIYEFSGRYSQQSEQSVEQHTEKSTTTDSWREKPSHVADMLRTANEDYMAKMRRQFEQSHADAMAQIAIMTNINNIRNR